MRIIASLALGIGAAATLAVTAEAASICNGFLTMTIDDTNGAIDTTVLGAEEFYKKGVDVADWAMQVGTNTGTFRVNRIANLATGIPVTSVTQLTPRRVSVAARYTPNPGVDIAITRTYTLLSGLNVVRIDTRMTNIRPSGTGLATIRAFGTYDPDQITSTTINDVTSEASSKIALASNAGGLSVAIGGPPNNAAMVVGFGGGSSPFGLEIGSGAELNTLFATPFDPDGAAGDLGVAVARQFGVAPGNSKTFRYYHAFGSLPEDSLAGIRFGAREAAGSTAATLAALDVVTPVPAALPLLATAVGGLGYVGWRRRRKGAA